MNTDTASALSIRAENQELRRQNASLLKLVECYRGEPSKTDRHALDLLSALVAKRNARVVAPREAVEA